MLQGKKIPAVVHIPTNPPFVKKFYDDFLHSKFNVCITDNYSCNFIKNVQIFTWEIIRHQNVNVAISITPAERISDIIFSAELIDKDSCALPDILLNSDGILLDSNSCYAEFDDGHFTQISQECHLGDLCFEHYFPSSQPPSVKNFFPLCKNSQPVFDEKDYDDFLPDLPVVPAEKFPSKKNKVHTTAKLAY